RLSRPVRRAATRRDPRAIRGVLRRRSMPRRRRDRDRRSLVRGRPMSPLQEQLVALGAVFEAAVLADKIARTGQVSEASMSCMLGSLLVRDPQGTLDVYGGDDLNLRDGY